MAAANDERKEEKKSQEQEQEQVTTQAARQSEMYCILELRRCSRVFELRSGLGELV